MAILKTPNILVHDSFGKILFALFDLIDAILIRLIVQYNLNEYEGYKININNKNGSGDSIIELNPPTNNRRNRKKSRQQLVRYSSIKSSAELTSDIAMLVWLYNPLIIAITTRGNCDSLAGFFVLATLYCLQCRKQYSISG